MVQDNPYLEVWRSLSLDQTELNIFDKWSRLDQIWENDPPPLIDIDNLDPTSNTIYILNLCGHWWQRGRETKIVVKIVKKGEKYHKGRDMTKERDQLKFWAHK